MSKAIEYLTKNVEKWDNEGSGRIVEMPRDDYDAALTILKEQPEAGDLAMNKEAIDLLENARNKKPADFVRDGTLYDGWKRYCGHLQSAIFQVLAILKEQPPAEESDDWMKSATEFYELGGCPICFSTDEAGCTEGCYLGQLQVRLDRSEASRNELLAACRQAFNESHNPEVEKILKAAIKANKEGD